MSFTETLLNGEEGLFKPKTLTPMQKLTLRFVVVGLVYYLFVIIEGMIMRLYEISPLPFVSEKQFFAILTAHPLVGIFGSTYSIVCGAFLFLVPFLMKKPLWSFRLANWTFLLIAIGTFIFWSPASSPITPPFTPFTGRFRPISASSRRWEGHFLSWESHSSCSARSFS
jgi:cytochrome c oxidase subunit 1